MAIEYNASFEQREITLRIALLGIMYMGGVSSKLVRSRGFHAMDAKMASTFVHTIEKK